MLLNNLQNNQAEIPSIAPQAQPGLAQMLSDPYNKMNFMSAMLSAPTVTSTPQGFGASFGNAVNYMQQAQRQREQDMMQKQLQQSQLASQQFNLQQAQRQAMLEQQRQQQLSGLIGEAPTMVNNMQGTGYLGGQLSPLDLLKQTSLALLRTGDEKTGVSLLQLASNPYLYYTDEQKQLAAAGIDPNSPQGKNILQGDIIGKTPVGQIDLIRQEAVNNEVGKADVKTLKESTDVANQSAKLAELLQQYKSLSHSVSPWSQGPLVGHLSPIYDAKNVQQLQNLSARIIPMARALSGFPNQRITNQELSFLSSGGLSPTTSPDAVDAIVESMLPQAQENVMRGDFYRNKFDKDKSLSNAETEFQDFLNKPKSKVTPTSALGVGMPNAPGSSASPLTPLVVPGMQSRSANRVVPTGHHLAGQPITKVIDYSAFGGK